MSMFEVRSSYNPVNLISLPNDPISALVTYKTFEFNKTVVVKYKTKIVFLGVTRIN